VEISKRKAFLAAVVLTVVAGLAGGGVALAVQSFTDVPPSHAFASEIEWAASNGIVNGYPDGSFKPSANVTRQAAAAFQSRYNDSIRLSVVTAQFHAGNPTPNLTANCPAGKRALSGGGLTSSGKLVMSDSYPVVAGGGSAVAVPNDAVAWRVYWQMNNTQALDATTNFYVWVLCAPAFAG